MFYVYVLECADNKYYVGETMDIDRRWEMHESGRGSEWTRIYEPIRIEWYGRTNNRYLEFAKTLEYMETYGIDNVRGGPYCSVFLREWTMEFIYNRLSDTCFDCGRRIRNGHYNGCPNCHDCGRRHYGCCCYLCGKPGHLSGECRNCSRCGGNDHFTDECNQCYKCRSRNHFGNRCGSCLNCGGYGHRANNCYLPYS
nr:14432_t:CDS:1 [Entrophospora candida]